MVVDTINKSYDFYHTKLFQKDIVYVSGKGKFAVLLYESREISGSEMKDYVEVFLTEYKDNLCYYIDLRSDTRFKSCNDLHRSKDPREKEFYENNTKSLHQPFFKLAKARWLEVLENIKSILD
jgi:hypothetical protein